MDALGPTTLIDGRPPVTSRLGIVQLFLLCGSLAERFLSLGGAGLTGLWPEGHSEGSRWSAEHISALATPPEHISDARLLHSERLCDTTNTLFKVSQTYQALFFGVGYYPRHSNKAT